MHEREFERRYRHLQEGVTATEKLKESTLKLMRAEAESCAASATEALSAEAPSASDRGSTACTQPYACAAHTATRPKGKPTPRNARPKHTRRRIGFAVAACTVAILLAFGLMPVPFGSLTTQPGTTANGTAEMRFAVKAYAATTNEPVEESDGELIVFPQDTHTPDGFSAEEDGGVYTGLLFTVQGDDVARVQATLSTGEFYSYKTEEITKASDPEKYLEATTWKPTTRGMGTYYGNYNAVNVVMLEGTASGKREDDTPLQVRLIKRLGQTIDRAVSEEEPLCLGLRFNDLAVSETHYLDFSKLEGQTMTVTVQFGDGTYQTQVIELHQGTFRVDAQLPDEESVVDALPVGKPVDPATLPEDEPSTTTLYGKVISTTDEPHPYSLENANALENEPVSAYDVSRLIDYIGPSCTVEASVRADQLHDRETGMSRNARYDESEFSISISHISSPSIRKTLPDSLDLYKDTDIASLGGSLEYANACRSALFGWSVDESGTLCDGFTFVVLEMDVTNNADQEEIFNTRDVGSICSLRNNAIEFSSYSLFGSSSWPSMSLAAHETLHVEAVFIVSDELLSDGDLALANRDGVRSDSGVPDLSRTQFVKL